MSLKKTGQYGFFCFRTNILCIWFCGNLVFSKILHMKCYKWVALSYQTLMRTWIYLPDFWCFPLINTCDFKSQKPLPKTLMCIIYGSVSFPLASKSFLLGGSVMPPPRFLKGRVLHSSSRSTSPCRSLPAPHPLLSSMRGDSSTGWSQLHLHISQLALPFPSPAILANSSSSTEGSHNRGPVRMAKPCQQYTVLAHNKHSAHVWCDIYMQKAWPVTSGDPTSAAV